MAIDTKSQHVGNHGGTYTDNDGQSKQFTYIDHDKKQKISSHLSPSQNELEEMQKRQEDYTAWKIEFVLLLPAINIVDASGGVYNTLVKMDGEKVIWNKEAVSAHLKGNINSFLPTMIWRRTVPEASWFIPAWLNTDEEFFRKGEWKNLIP